VEIEIINKDGIPAFMLKGKFDGAGAARFEADSAGLEDKCRFWILDFSEVTYLSSIGIRSILKAEKTLRAVSGNLFIVINSNFVRQVLEVSGLINQLKIIESVDEGFKKISQLFALYNKKTERIIEGRIYEVQAFSENESFIDIWANKESYDKTDMTSVSFKDLGAAFGVGGFGANSSQAAESKGYFISTQKFSGLLPFGENQESDFIFSENPADTFVYVSNAYGISGKASLFLEHKYSMIGFDSLISDLFILAAEKIDENVNSLAYIIKAQSSGSAKKSLIIWGKAAVKGTVLDLKEDSKLYNDLRFFAAGLMLQHNTDVKNPLEPEDYLNSVIDLDEVEKIINITPETKLQNLSIWLFTPKVIRSGEEKLIKIETPEGLLFREEWDIIIRKIYADCSRVILTPLHGGYMSKTFSVESYDKEGRKIVPTVVKISSLEIAQREEFASKNYVEKFIMNNSTLSMGSAVCGDWAGIRYNFLGITGADTKLTWLRNLYIERSAEEVSKIFASIFTNILKPWYGQPKLEPVYLYADHTPLRLFPNLFEQVKKDFGYDAESETILCEELGIDLPNPFRFLKYQYEERKTKSQMWYTSICHGDLNMQNILLDEKENIYIIDFSETKPRNVVSDFARLEPVFKFEIPKIETEEDLKNMLEFEAGLTSVNSLEEIPPFNYKGNDPAVKKAYELICQFRKYANTVTLFETDIKPYLLALLEWTYSVMCYVQLNAFTKKYAAYSAAMMVKKLL
jgi:anti-anti-sigma factor